MDDALVNEVRSDELLNYALFCILLCQRCIFGMHDANASVTASLPDPRELGMQSLILREFRMLFRKQKALGYKRQICGVLRQIHFASEVTGPRYVIHLQGLPTPTCFQFSKSGSDGGDLLM